MSLGIRIDMNLSIEWVTLIEQAGWPAVHWSAVGDPRAQDATIMEWAVARGRIVLTHDLDFGTALALTHARGPSVIQVRSQNVLPEHCGPLELEALQRYEVQLTSRALGVVDEARSRVRVLPLGS